MTRSTYAITIYDTNTSPQGTWLSFDLLDILSVIGEPAARSKWRCAGVECLGALSDDLHALSDSGEWITGEQLFNLAAGVYQTIDGYFYARNAGADHDWLAIRAVDSSCFDVESTDAGVIQDLKQRFRLVRDFPADAGTYL
jgi:hypothetical protein